MNPETLFWIVPLASIIALAFAAVFFFNMKKADEGTDRMKEIAGYVREGAMAYLKQQYKVVALVFVIIAIIFCVMAVFDMQNHIVPVAFLTGGFFSGLAGFIGMKTATYASGRVAQACRDEQDGLNKGLKLAFRSGAVLGLTRGVTRAHIVRATLESLAYQVADVLAAMGSDASARLNVLKVDGGAAANGFLLQFQSDVTGVPVERPASVETTALGAAMLAGLAVGFWENLESLRSLRRVSCRFLPAWNDEKRSESLAKWHEAVGCVQTRR